MKSLKLGDFCKKLQANIQGLAVIITNHVEKINICCLIVFVCVAGVFFILSHLGRTYYQDGPFRVTCH